MSRVVFTLSDLDQATAPRHLRQGSLTVSQNTRQTKNGTRRKRKGFARSTVSTFSFPISADDTDSSPSATMQELSPGGVMFRDANENIWARDSAGSTAYFRGEHRRCAVTQRATGFPEHKTIKPVSIAVGTQVWTIALSTTSTGATPGAEPTYNCWWVLVEDANGTVVRGPTQYSDGTGNSVMNYSAVYHPGTSKVYIFSVYRNTTIQVFSIATSTGAVADAQAQFWGDGDTKWNCIDTIYDTTAAKVVAAYTSWKEDEAPGDVAVVRHGSLNTSTLAETNGTESESFNPGVTGAFLCSGVSFLQGQPFTDNKLRYVYWVKGDANQDDVLVIHVTINATTLAETGQTVIYTTQSTKYTLEHAGICSGYYDSGSDTSVVFADLQRFEVSNEETSTPASLANVFNSVVARLAFNNGTTTVTSSQSAWARGSWLASKPFQGTSSVWYVLTGADSGSDGFQRAFHVRRADVGFTRNAPDRGRVVAQIFWPDASFRNHRWRGQQGAALPQNINNSWGWAPTVAAVTGGCKIALGRSGETPQSHAIYACKIDFAAAFSRGAQVYDDAVVYPGGVPTIASPRFPTHDLVPLMFPFQAPRLTAAGSSSALGACQVTASFRFRDPTGRITRSTSYPTPSSLTFNSGGTRTLAVRNLLHIGHGTAEIELWSTVPGGTSLCLQFIVPNDPTTEETSIDVDPARFRDDTETLPISATGALAANPPPPCRLVTTFADRIVVSGTPVEGEFLYSQPFEAGLGPEFNIEALQQIWTGRGHINAMGPVDLNTLAFLRRDQVACVQGTGPDGSGGAYGQILELNTGKGVELSSSRGQCVFQTPMGLHFQDFESGRLCTVQPGLRVEEMPAGVEDTATGSLLVAGGLQSADMTVWFQLASGVPCVIDLRRPEQTTASAWGNWHTWTSTALTASPSVGLVEKDGGPLFLQADGGWRTYKTSGQIFQDATAAGGEADILQVLTTGTMAPDGMHGEVYISDLQVLGTHVSASSARFTTSGDAGAEAHDVTLSSPFNYSWRPGNLLRTQEFALTIAELAGSTGEGFELDSIGVEFEAQGRMKRLNTTRIV
jgi:hypothetical protein